jgi:hypothetical protein
VASELRNDGQPYVTEITPSMRNWLCRGGVDPDRIIPAGMKLEWLLLLWNLRAEKRECGHE